MLLRDRKRLFATGLMAIGILSVMMWLNARTLSSAGGASGSGAGGGRSGVSQVVADVIGAATVEYDAPEAVERSGARSSDYDSATQVLLEAAQRALEAGKSGIKKELKDSTSDFLKSIHEMLGLEPPEVEEDAGEEDGNDADDGVGKGGESEEKPAPVVPSHVVQMRDPAALKQFVDSRPLVFASLITFTGKDPMMVLRNVVGSIHVLGDPDAKLVLYLLGFSKILKGEINIFRNVEIVDVVEEFMQAKSDYVSGEYRYTVSELGAAVEDWSPTVIHHAVEKYGKVLFFTPQFFVRAGILAWAEANFASAGSIFMRPLSADKFTAHVQGYTLGSAAYEQIIVPRARCTFSPCAIASGTIGDDINVGALKYKSLEERVGAGYFEAYNSPLDEATGKERFDCEIRFKTDWAFTATPVMNLSPEQRAAKETAVAGRHRIALGVPTTSRKLRITRPRDLLLFSILIQSTLMSMTEWELGHVTVEFYVGFDEGDPYWDNANNVAEVQAYFEQLTHAYPNTFRLELMRFRQSHGWTTFLWNGLFERAILDGCEWFFQVNDDLQIMSPGWATEFMNKLRDSHIRPYFGIAGPHDVNNDRLMTQTFVHKTHFDVMKRMYFPWEFKNWYNDDWATSVYESSGARFWVRNIKVRNTNVKGTRYAVCGMSRARLDEALQAGHRNIQEWLATHPMPGYPKELPPPPPPDPFTPPQPESSSTNGSAGGTA